MPDALGVDIVAVPGVDLLGDLDRGLPLRDSSVDVLHAYHVLEHVPDFTRGMSEIWRVLKPGGRAHIKVPHACSNFMTWKDPTHRRGLMLATFAYFDDTYFDGAAFSYYANASFRIEKARLCFTATGPPVPMPARDDGSDAPLPEPHGFTVARRVLNPMASAIANKSRGFQYACERFWGPLVGIEEVHVVMRAIK